MGACFSPSLANLYICWWEEDHLYATSNPYRAHIAWYGRYIDDLLLVWQREASSLKDFYNFLNINNHNLRFTMESNKTSIHFLDVMLYHKNNQVLTNLFWNSTAGNGLLRSGQLPLKTCCQKFTRR